MGKLAGAGLDIVVTYTDDVPSDKSQFNLNAQNGISNGMLARASDGRCLELAFGGGRNQQVSKELQDFYASNLR